MRRTTRVPGLVLTEHELDVPLDHASPGGPKLTLFAREVAAPDGADRPLLVFLQGGPGFEAPRPLTPGGPAWLACALRDYHVLMVDQRGTGRSTPVGRLAGLTPAAQAAYLRHFRADAIVRDLELLRGALGSPPWSVLGQSFGGFCVVAYLSLAPEGLREALVTGGLPPIARHADDVYRATYARVVGRNHAYYERYPDDRPRVQDILQRLEREVVRLPSGDRLSPRRFRQLGHVLGMSDGAERLHYVVEQPLDSPGFLHDVETGLPFARNPIYAILHESSYSDGCVTAWSAERLLASSGLDADAFTGEMVFSWMFEEYSALAPLREAAELLATEPWPKLYDAARLRTNQVPVAAAIYTEDMYVERAFSEETAKAIGNLRPWITNEHEHNGLRADERVFTRLVDMLRGRA
jgi:pimeloyl-ACP methyl ester carboxylesterase